MPASTIAQILMRLFALGWVLTSLASGASTILVTGWPWANGNSLLSYGSTFVYLAAGGLFWAFAPHISRMLVGKNDGEMTLNGVTRADLYSTVILGLGLYFVLNSLANVFNWIHYIAVERQMMFEYEQGNDVDYYAFSNSAMTLAAGLLLIWKADRFTRMILRGQKPLPKEEPQD